MKRNYLSFLFSAILFVFALGSCIEDGFTTSPSDQPVFSTDTLDMGVIFTEQASTTHRFTVYNRADKSLNISHISLSGENAGYFRLNVDGFTGKSFDNVEIRANDSIIVFVETTLPANGRNLPVQIDASLDFLTNGVSRSVIIAASGRDVTRLYAHTITESTTLSADKPYQIFDSLVVAPGAVLTIPAGAELFFHDKASMIVHGTLIARGECGNEITMSGDRTGNVAADISFDIMSRQWDGLHFTPSSTANELSYVHLCNTTNGVTVTGPEESDMSDKSDKSDKSDSSDKSDLSEADYTLLLINSRLRNSGNYALEVHNANLSAYGTEIAEAASGALLLDGGSHIINHCTLTNYYLFSALQGPILQFTEDDNETPTPAAEISNTIIYGLGRDISHGDLTGTDIYLRSCLLKSAGDDDDNFIECLWDTDPMFYTVRQDYFFDYRIQPESAAIGAANPALTAPQSASDRYGLPRGAAPDLGAYVFNPDLQQ